MAKKRKNGMLTSSRKLIIPIYDEGFYAWDHNGYDGENLEWMREFFNANHELFVQAKEVDPKSARGKQLTQEFENLLLEDLYFMLDEEGRLNLQLEDWLYYPSNWSWANAIKIFIKAQNTARWEGTFLSRELDRVVFYEKHLQDAPPHLKEVVTDQFEKALRTLESEYADPKFDVVKKKAMSRVKRKNPVASTPALLALGIGYLLGKNEN
jgi:hypothetical protein